jgi:hypothetical protein
MPDKLVRMSKLRHITAKVKGGELSVDTRYGNCFTYMCNVGQKTNALCILKLQLHLLLAVGTDSLDASVPYLFITLYF